MLRRKYCYCSCRRRKTGGRKRRSTRAKKTTTTALTVIRGALKNKRVAAALRAKKVTAKKR